MPEHLNENTTKISKLVISLGKLKKYISLLVLLLLVMNYALAQVYTWSGKNDDLLIGPNVQYYHDTSGTAPIDIVSKLTNVFQPTQNRFTYIIQLQGAHWLKFNIQGNPNHALILELSRVEIKSAILYSKDSLGQWQLQKAGYDVPLRRKPLKGHYQAFKLNSITGEYFLRVQTEYNAFVPLKVSDASWFEYRVLMQNMWSGIYIGMMIFVLLYNLFLYISFRRFYFLPYAIVVLLYLGHSVFEGGEIFYFFPGINFGVLFPYPAMTNPIFTMVFLYSFLKVKENAPRWVSKFVLITIAFYFSFFVGSFVIKDPATKMNLVFLISVFNIISLIIICTATGRKNRFGYWVMIPYLLMLFSVIISIISLSTGSPPPFMGLPHSNLGFLIDLVLLAYIISIRFKLEQKQEEAARLEAQELLYLQTKENERIIINQNILLEQKVTERTKALEQQKLVVEKTNNELEETLGDLKSTQAQLIHSEKMASLGELTAGIAHEIQNPLNFVTNFSEVSSELLDEMKTELANNNKDEVLVIADDLKRNLEKINHHGKTVGNIVKGMLQHSRASTGQKELTDINALAEEYLRLSFLGFRAKDESFNAQIKTDFDETLSSDKDGNGKIRIVPADIGRALLNLINNAFYVVLEKKKKHSHDESFEPTVLVSTRREKEYIEIRVKDNGFGIPKELADKIFQPFFTTKPTGEGTGLGLSLSYDIITKEHGGELKVVSKENEGAEFIIKLPIKN